MLEAALHSDNTFLTVTYSDENLPDDLSVTPRALQLFIKRLRKAYPSPIRYFACGEYGDQYGRPHYHLALFGHENCRRGITRFTRDDRPCCDVCSRTQQAWGLGTIKHGTLTEQSAEYVAGYINKKMTKDDDPRLEGRRPEFARMSLRPAVGLFMMHELASQLLELNCNGEDGRERMIDVPLTLSHGRGKTLPLGRFLRRKLRTYIGREANAPAEVLHKSKEELQAMRKIAWDIKVSLKTQVLQENEGKRIQIEARQQRQRKNRSL